MGYLTRDGVKLHYEEAGAGEPAIVLIHGWCCDRTYFAPQAAHFAPTRRCISVDLRGHGQSDKPEQEYSIAGFADDVAWLCAQLGVERPVVAGHSMGGLVALAMDLLPRAEARDILVEGPAAVHERRVARGLREDGGIDDEAFHLVELPDHLAEFFEDRHARSVSS